LVDHLDELRTRAVRIVIVFVLALVVGFFVAQPIIQYLIERPPVAEFELNVFSPWDSLRIYINVAMLAAILISLPFAIFQIWRFVSPGLHDKERRAALYYIPVAVVLGLFGLAFAYFVVPAGVLLYAVPRAIDGTDGDLRDRPIFLVHVQHPDPGDAGV